MITPSSIATLVVFIIHMVFVIRPIRIALPMPGHFRIYFPLNLTTSPILAIAILWASQCLGTSVVWAGISGTEDTKPYNILLLIFSLAYMTVSFDITGVPEAAAHWVLNKQRTNGRKLFLYFFLMFTLVSIFFGSNLIPTGTAILVSFTKELELHPLAWLIAVFSAANIASMVLFVGNPTNGIICQAFGIHYLTYSAYVIFPFLACICCGFFALIVQFRHEKYIARFLSTSGQKDPRVFLRDPVAAWVGGVMLTGYLMTVLVMVGFFSVDGWKVSVPFATAKFIFDILWDHYNYRRQPLLHDSVSRGETRLYGLKGRSPLGPRNGAQPFPSADGPIQQGATHSTSNSVTNRDDAFLAAVGSQTHTVGDEVRFGKAEEMQGPRSGRPIPLTGSLVQEDSLTSRPTPAPFWIHLHLALAAFDSRFQAQFPTVYTALPRLPFTLIPFAFSQFILIEALALQGWTDLFAFWLVRATGRYIYPTIWFIGVLDVILCSFCGTNISAAILFIKIIHASALPKPTSLGAAITLAVASNIGTLGFTFSSSMGGLLWNEILAQAGLHISQKNFAFWNILPSMIMCIVGFGVVCIEMLILYKSS